MDSKSIQKFRSMLVAERERITANSKDTIQHELNVNLDDLPDEVDLAATEVTQALVFELRNRERQILSKINTALGKIDQGTFGECESCGDDIQQKRLEARPFSVLCVNCQEQLERKQKLYA